MDLDIIDDEYYYYLIEDELRELVSVNTIIKAELLKSASKNTWNTYFFDLYDTNLYNMHINTFRDISYRTQIRYVFNIRDAIDYFENENKIIKNELMDCVNLFNNLKITNTTNENTFSYPSFQWYPSVFIGDC